MLGPISSEIRASVADLPLYQGGPGVDYTHADTAYAVNVTLLHDPNMQRSEQGLWVPRPETEALVVQRASGDGVIGSWSSVSGYVDTVHDPEGVIPDEEFDPIMFTAGVELSEECNLPFSVIDSIEFCLGERFSEPRGNRGVIHVLPLLGIYPGEQKPGITINEDELMGYSWMPLNRISSLRPNLSPGYMENTLPHALGTTGLQAAEVSALLGVEV
jgi:8-oxo-dGTP pyrophosphatase MutT (NUDIX family)